MPVLARTEVDKNDRTTVPREVRKLLELNDSDSIEWACEESNIREKGRQVMAWPSY